MVPQRSWASPALSNGDAITGLLAAGALGDNDNLIYLGSPQLDGDGYARSPPLPANLTCPATAPCGGAGYLQNTDGTCNTAVAVAFSAREVPEPASAAFFILGLAAIGVMRQRA